CEKFARLGGLHLLQGSCAPACLVCKCGQIPTFVGAELANPFTVRDDRAGTQSASSHRLFPFRLACALRAPRVRVRSLPSGYPPPKYLRVGARSNENRGKSRPCTLRSRPGCSPENAAVTPPGQARRLQPASCGRPDVLQEIAAMTTPSQPGNN